MLNLITIGLAIICSVVVLNIYDRGSNKWYYNFPTKYKVSTNTHNVLVAKMNHGYPSHKAKRGVRVPLL